MRIRPKINNQGFSLLETLIALFLLSVMSVAIFTALRTSDRFISSSDDTAAAEYMRNVALQIKSRHDNDITKNPLLYLDDMNSFGVKGQSSEVTFDGNDQVYLMFSDNKYYRVTLTVQDTSYRLNDVTAWTVERMTDKDTGICLIQWTR